MKLLRRLVASLALSSLCTACYVYSPNQVLDQSTPIGDLDGIRLVGTTQGESCQSFFLGIPLSPEEPIYNAYEDAKAKVGASAIINVRIDSVSSSFPFYATQCVSVRGDGVVSAR